MRFFALLCLYALAPVAVASPENPPWWPDLADEVDDDAAANPDTDDDAIAAPVVDLPPRTDQIDLAAPATALEDGVGRVLRDGLDPTKALPLDVEAPSGAVAAELRGLLTGSGARTARLHAMRVHLVLTAGGAPVAVADALLLPGKGTAILRLGPLKAGVTTEPAVLWPGGLGAGWRQAEDQLTTLLRAGRCTAIPVVDDATLARLTPAAFLPAAKKSRDEALVGRADLCKAAAATTWDRAEIRPIELHFNLFDSEEKLRGGLRLVTQSGPGPRFSYPQFKNLPE
jgi:hypothetical protein